MHSFFKLYILIAIFPILLQAEYYLEEREPIDLSMVISGGVSLGAYEAGYNWAMVKMLSNARERNKTLDIKLRSVTGASAGSINALLSAMYWCQELTIEQSFSRNPLP